ncbi:MAG TPA: hypothetical protein VIY53_15290 [Acidobacteriaceae bacterium]
MNTETPAVIPATPRRSWSARLLSLPTVMGMALVSFLFLFTGTAPVVTSIGDPDIWWHLRDAAQLLRTGHFIRTESWSFTVAGKPWIDFEWLAELPYYAAWNWIGDRGLYLMMMMLVSAIVAGVYWLGCRRSGDCKAAFLASFVGLHFVTVSLGPRTLLFGWIYLVIELAILWELERGRDFTWALPPLFLLWVNTHGSWLVGFVLMAAFFACGFVHGEWGNLYAVAWTGRQKRKFVAITAASLALTFVNPYGAKLVLFPINVAYRMKINMQSVHEWFSIDFHTARGKLVFATLALFALLQLVRRRRWRLQDLALLLIAVYGAFTYVRFVFLLGIVLTPLLAEEFRGVLGPYQAAKDRRSVNAIALAVLLLAIWFSWPADRRLQAAVTDAYPQKALPYIRSIAGHGQVFNDFDWGGYLAWNVPELPLFIDGRVDIFAYEGVMDDYVRALDLQDSFGILDKYRIRYVFIAPDFPLAYLLDHSPAWKTTYRDTQSVVFERVR